MATNDVGEPPRAVIHKRILDSAEADSEASMAEIADGIPGASPDLVERVLEEYGDPGLGAPHGSTQEPPMTEHVTAADDTTLTDKQREALEAIVARPDATQAELADHLGVSRATVNKRVNAIEGFEWQERQAFAEAVLDDDAEPPPADATAASDGGQLLAGDADRAVAQLQERLARLEQLVGDGSAARGPVLGDAGLMAKVVRAVVSDQAISEDEELRVLEALL